MAKRIAILTGGGDVPGLNSCIRSVAERAVDEGCELVGIRRGWAGLLHLDPHSPDSRAEYLQDLDKRTVRTVSRYGGTFLHTSRCNPAAVSPDDLPPKLAKSHEAEGGVKIDCTPAILDSLAALDLDGLITIGGDDTLSYSERLSREQVPVIAIPKTMDNDVQGTDYCIGFSTAVTRSVNFINDLRTVAGSHERILVVELFGRNSGETALISSWLADVDRTVISEVPFDPLRLSELLKRDKYRNPSRYAVLTISEGASMTGSGIVESGEEDAYGHRKLGGIGKETAELIKKQTGERIAYQPLSYLMRAGMPDSLDRMVARNFGNLAMDLLLKGEFGRMVRLDAGCYGSIPLSETVGGRKIVDVDRFYDVDKYRAKVEGVVGMPMFLY